jgi:hypothetical protein
MISLKPTFKLASLLLVLIVVDRSTQDASNPVNMCKLYVGDKVFNFTGIFFQEELHLNYLEQQSGHKFTVVGSLCTPLDLDLIKRRIPENKREGVIYTPPPEGMRPNVVIIKNTNEDSYQIFDLAYINTDTHKKWNAIPHYDSSSESWLRPETYSLEMLYDIRNVPIAQELGLSNIRFRNICLKEWEYRLSVQWKESLRANQRPQRLFIGVH